jgi:hypothetical protein
LSKYRLKFLPEALEEWKALDGSVREDMSGIAGIIHFDGRTVEPDRVKVQV